MKEETRHRTRPNNPGQKIRVGCYTSTAGRILARASEEARSLGHAKTDTGHLVFSIAVERGSPAATVLSGLGITQPALRAAARQHRQHSAAVPQGRPVYTWRLRRVLRRAMTLSTGCVSAEHLLLAVIQEDRGTGAQALAALGARPAQVKATVQQIITGRQEE